MGLVRTLICENAAVASEQPLASLAGYEAMREGGNAFDAAVATSLSLAVTFHPAGGIGGDFFGMLYEAKTGRVHCLNSSGWAPSGIGVESISAKGNGVPTYGPLTCTVPGFIAGVWSMHQKLGSMPFKDLARPATGYATHGFPAGEALCRSTSSSFESLSDSAKRVFAPRGTPPMPGEWIRQEALGRVLSEVSEGGPDAFYKGWPAERICSALQAGGVRAELDDFDFTPEWVEPVTFDYRGTKVHEVPPNSMGVTSLLMLKQLAEAGLEGAGPLSQERITRTMKAAELAYGRRDELLGDPRFGPVDVKEFMESSNRASGVPASLSGGDTTAFSVADAVGNIVSGIQSLFHHFGSRVFVPEAGLMLNNRGAGFSLSGPNKAEPRKRPLHTLSSVILSKDDRPFVGIGASGGEYRPMQHTLFITNLVDYGMPLEQAVEHQRFLWSGGRTVIAERGYDAVDSSLYEVRNLPFPGRTGVCHAVAVADHYRKAVCDMRGDGIPAGF
ncbi:MAG: gamma-glutamyltransferase family protein [Thaumarchaeota archaeon]|nr:gamma-glutamyltransferase family protein [Nitrososphaerota archaeon]